MRKFLSLDNWIKNQRKKNTIKLVASDIRKIQDWKFNKKKIYHKSKIFFSILAFRLYQKNIKKTWYQPLIIQKEVGILGIIKRKVHDKSFYLLQAKAEPGNKNGIQLSPTVQATKSNYLRKHKGKKTKFLDFFLKKNKKLDFIKKKRLSEQGSRYDKKSNFNILIELKRKTIQIPKNYVWLGSEELKYLIKKKNLMNMDTLSVFSCCVKKDIENFNFNTTNTLIKLVKQFKKKNEITKKQISFFDLKNWQIKKNIISDNKKNFFAIRFFNVKANLREVKKWSQPLLSDFKNSLNTFLVKREKNQNFYLLKIIIEPGLSSAKFTSTLNIKNYNPKKDYSKIEFFNFFKSKNGLQKFIYSDEGGRFYRNETHNYVKILKKNDKLNIKKNFYWVSHNQIIDLINKNLVSIEARNLFACFNIDKIK